MSMPGLSFCVHCSLTFSAAPRTSHTVARQAAVAQSLDEPLTTALAAAAGTTSFPVACYDTCCEYHRSRLPELALHDAADWLVSRCCRHLALHAFHPLRPSCTRHNPLTTIDFSPMVLLRRHHSLLTSLGALRHVPLAHSNPCSGIGLHNPHLLCAQASMARRASASLGPASARRRRLETPCRRSRSAPPPPPAMPPSCPRHRPLRRCRRRPHPRRRRFTPSLCSGADESASCSGCLQRLGGLPSSSKQRRSLRRDAPRFETADSPRPTSLGGLCQRYVPRAALRRCLP